MRWKGHVGSVVDRRDAYRGWYGDLMGRDHSEDLSLDGRIVLKLILEGWNGEAWT